MPDVFKIGDAVAGKYDGAGVALAAVTGGELVGLVYLRDVFEGFDDSEFDPECVVEAINDPRIGPTVRELSALGEVFVGMCSCYEFIVL